MCAKEERRTMKSIKKMLKRLVIICIVIYTVVTFCNQQKILNTYAANKEEIEKKLSQAEEYSEQLKKIKENVNSKEYIEEVAREKLDMYLPNERVYINQE